MECNPSFRLYLVSPDSISVVPPGVASLVTTVVFYPEIRGLQESVLDAFLKLQNQKTSHDRGLLRDEIYSQSVQLEEVEEELLKVLVKQENGHLEDPRAAKHILFLNKSYEDAKERQVFRCRHATLYSDSVDSKMY